MNTGAPWPGLDEAEARVLEIQAKLHQWAKVAPNRRFDDLYNLVYDPAILVVAWSRVRTNRGARSAGVDKVGPRSIASPTERLLPLLREQLNARQFGWPSRCEWLDAHPIGVEQIQILWWRRRPTDSPSTADLWALVLTRKLVPPRAT